MALTIEQIASKVLQKLVRQRDVGAEDLENVTDAYNCIYQQLADDGLVTWSATDDIPDRFTLPIIEILCSELASSYGVPEPSITWKMSKLSAINTIRRQLATGQDAESVCAEYM